VQNVKRGFY